MRSLIVLSILILSTSPHGLAQYLRENEKAVVEVAFSNTGYVDYMRLNPKVDESFWGKLGKKVDRLKFDSKVLISFDLVAFNSYIASKNKQISPYVMEYVLEQEGSRFWPKNVKSMPKSASFYFRDAIEEFSWFGKLKSALERKHCKATLGKDFDFVKDGRLHLINSADVKSLNETLVLTKEWYSFGVSVNILFECLAEPMQSNN